MRLQTELCDENGFQCCVTVYRRYGTLSLAEKFVKAQSRDCEILEYKSLGRVDNISIPIKHSFTKTNFHFRGFSLLYSCAMAAISIVRELENLSASTPISSKTIEEFSRILSTQLQHLSLLEILPCFQTLSIALSGSVEHAPQLSLLNDEIKNSYSGLLSFLPDTETPALFFPRTIEKSLTHRSIRSFISSFDLGLYGHHRVVVALPNGPTMGLACLAVATYYTLCPMTPTCGAAQFKADVQRVQASAILVQDKDVEALKLKDATWICDAGIKVFGVKEKEDGTFKVRGLGQEGVQVEVGEDRPATRDLNTADDIAILLFTSGTSGTKKVVPITLHNVIVGVADVAKSWGLTGGDQCLNMMPLWHM